MKTLYFDEWAILWIEKKREYVKESTYATYLIMIRNHLIPELGRYRVNAITKEVVQDMILKLCTCGGVRNQKALANKTVKDMIIVLKMCLKDYGIYDERIFRKNVFKYPSDTQESSTMKILDEETFSRMIRMIRKDGSCEAVGYALGLLTGMRIGEICALQWKDIDLNRKTIHITKTLQRIYYKEGERGSTRIVISSPKSKAGRREIPIPDRLGIILDYEHVSDENYYVLSGNDKYVEPRLYRRHFQKFLKQNNLENMRFHDLRHTFATRCIEKGGDYKTVSSILGHSSINMTMNRYVHPLLEQKRRCLELL